MSKKVVITIIGIVVVILVAVGIVLGMSASNKTAAPAVATNTTNSSTSAGNIIQTKSDANVGSYLADSNGNALYTYNADTSGTSNCSGACLSAWPAYAPGSSATLPTNVTIITRSDNTKQYAYKGLPLYTFASDSNGHVTGDGVGGFSVAKP